MGFIHTMSIMCLPPRRNSFPVYHGAGNKKQEATVFSPACSIDGDREGLYGVASVFFAVLEGVEEANASGVKQAPKDTDQAKATASTTT